MSYWDHVVPRNCAKPFSVANHFEPFFAMKISFTRSFGIGLLEAAIRVPRQTRHNV